MLLRSIFGWHMIDMTYIALNQTSTRVIGKNKGGKRKLNAPSHRPSFDELSLEVPHNPVITRLHVLSATAGKTFLNANGLLSRAAVCTNAVRGVYFKGPVGTNVTGRFYVALAALHYIHLASVVLRATGRYQGIYGGGPLVCAAPAALLYAHFDIIASR